MNEELNKTIKEFCIKHQKLIDEMTNYSKAQLISYIEREMNENHYLCNEIGHLRTELNSKDNIIKELIQWLEVNIKNLKRQKANNLYMEGVKQGMIKNADLILGKVRDLLDKEE